VQPMVETKKILTILFIFARHRRNTNCSVLQEGKSFTD
jgi:hypothetical protein